METETLGTTRDSLRVCGCFYCVHVFFFLVDLFIVGMQSEGMHHPIRIISVTVLNIFEDVVGVGEELSKGAAIPLSKLPVF